MTRRFIKWLGLAGLGVVLLLMTFPDVLLVPSVVLFGWVKSSRRLWSGLDPGSATLTFVVLALVVLLAGSHWFFSWLNKRGRIVGGGTPDTGVRPWSWRWTLSLHAGFWLVFFAIMSLVCITHQVGWMFASKEPIFVSRMWPLRARVGLQNAARVLAAAGNANDWDAAKMRAAIWEGRLDSAANHGALWESHHVILLPGTNGRLSAAIVMPREPKARSKVGLALVAPGTPVQQQPADSLPQILVRFQGNTGSVPANSKERP